MKRDEIITKLRAHEDDLRSLGVVSLALFGSAARNRNQASSDIDLAAIYDDSVVRDLMDMGGIAAEIEACLGTDSFDLASETNLHAHIRDGFQRNHVRIF